MTTHPVVPEPLRRPDDDSERTDVMPRNLPTSTTTRVDDLFTTWVAWRAACVGVEDAYREWVTASRSDRSHAFAWYCGALDAEAELSARLAGQSAGPLVAA
jgi:hypothetical protein